MIETLVINDYLNLGYPIRHSHRSVALLESISSIEKVNSNILVAGSSNRIYRSTNNGNIWSLLPDLNLYLEGDNEVNGVSTINTNGSSVLIGTTNGNIFSGKKYGLEIVPLEKPKVN